MASKFTITAELNLQTKNLGQVVSNLKRQFQGVDLNIKIKDLAKAESQLRNVSSEAKNASQSIGLLGSSVGTAFKRFTAVTLATGTIVGFTRAIKNAVGDAIEFQREVVKIAQATGKTTDQLKGLTSEISNVSSNFGVSSKELILAARSLTQAGFAADKVTGALKLLAQTELAATFDSIGDTTEGVIALLNQFGQVAQRSGTEIQFLEKSLSAINQVSKDFAVESSDLITAIRTTGSAFESAGGNLNELLALFTSVRSTTRESAESIATGFRTIFTRVQRLDTINNLRALGIELQDVEGKFIGPVEATKRLSIALNSIDPKDFRFNMIVEELGGFRQVSKVIPLIQQFATTQKALNVAQGASGSLAKDAATAQQALSVQIAKTREKFATFIRDMTESSAFQGTVKTLLSMAEAFLRVADAMKPLIPIIASFAAFKIGNSLIPGLRSLGANKKAEGGRIHAFAKGGLVPGQGNGDTVPAMLTPGEFVIKKSSVNKLGLKNLARANKYANGGIIKENTVGAAILEPGPSKVLGNVTYGKLQELFPEKKLSVPGIKKSKSWQVIGEGLSPETFQIFRDSIEEGLSKGLETAVNNASSIFSKDVGLTPAKIPAGNYRNNFLKTINEGSYGNVFEQVLSYAKVNGKFSESENPQRPFDFENGISTLLKDDYKTLSMRFVDAKASYAAATKKNNMFKKIAGEINQEGRSAAGGGRYLEDSLQSALAERGNVALRVNTTAEKAMIDLLRSKTADLVLSSTNAGKLREAILAGDFNNAGSKVPSTMKLFKNKDGNWGPTPEFTLLFNKAKRETGSNNPKDLSDYILRNSVSTLFASGGMASGTDTVPAMLTPGEYVINKKSAQAIGYSSLNRMNKVGKFANGGVVKHFATGGEVDKAFLQKTGYQGGAMGPMTPAQKALDVELLKAARYIKLMGNAQIETADVLKSLIKQAKAQGSAFKLTNEQVKEYGTAIKNAKQIQRLEKKNATAQSMIDSGGDIDKYKNIFKGAIDNSQQLSQNFVLVAGSITSVVAQMGALDKATADAVTSFATTFTAFYTIGQEFIDVGQSIIIEKRARAFNNLAMKTQQASINANKLAIDRLTAAFNEATGTILKEKVTQAEEKDPSLVKAEKQANRLSKVMNIANGALLGFSVALAAGNAAVSYYNAQAEKSAEALGKTIDKFKDSENLVNKNQLTASFSKAISDATYASTLNNSINGGSGMTTIGAGASAGALAGGVLGSIIPGIGTAIGAGIGGLVGAGAGLWSAVSDANEKFANQQKMATKASELMADSLYTSVTALNKFNKFLTNIDKKSRDEVAAQAIETSQSFAKASKSLGDSQVTIIRLFGSIKNAPELLARNLDALGSSVNELNKAVDALIGNLISRTAKDIANTVDIGGNSQQIQDEALKKYQAINNPRSDAMLESQFNPMIEAELQKRARRQLYKENEARPINERKIITEEDIAARKELLRGNIGEGMKGKLETVKSEKSKLDDLTFRKSLKEIELEALKTARIMLLEREAREAVVGSLIKELALTITLQNFNLNLERLSASLASIDSAFSGTISGLKSSIPNIKVLDLLKPTGQNLVDFNAALNKIRSIDQIGGNANIGGGIADSLTDVRKAALGLEIALERSAKELQNMNPAQVEKFVEDLLGGNAKGVVGKTLQKILNEAIKPAEGADAAGRGVGTAEGRQKIIDQFKKFAEELSEKGKGILQALTDAEKQQREIYDKINESRKRQLDLQLEDVDSFERYISAVARARGRELSLGEKNNLRLEKQVRMVGDLAGNTDAIGETLLQARKGLLESTDPAEQARLADTANKTEQALKALANQADRTNDTLAEIEKIKAQRENVRDIAKEFAIGTNEERANLQKDIQNALSVSQSGTFENLPEDQRKGASAILERFKDLPIFQGKTGREVQNKAIANSVRAAGGNEQIAQMIEQDTSSPEEKLIDELRNIYEEEVKAKEYLFQQENVMQEALINALEENARQTARLASDLEAEFNALANQQGRAGKPLNVADLDKQIEQVNNSLFFLTLAISTQTVTLDKALKDLNVAFVNKLGLTPFEEAVQAVTQSLLRMSDAVNRAAEKMLNAVSDILVQLRNKFIDALPANILNEKPNGAGEGEWKPPDASGGAAMGRATGGVVHRAMGGDIKSHPGKPKGTDTIPAWLTNGEFVVNAKATKKNRGLLEEINSGNYASKGGPIYRASGGAVNYYQSGNMVGRPTKFQSIMNRERSNARRSGRIRDLSAMGGTYSYNPYTDRYEIGGGNAKNPKIEAALIARELKLRKQIKELLPDNAAEAVRDQYSNKVRELRYAGDFQGAAAAEKKLAKIVKLTNRATFEIDETQTPPKIMGTNFVMADRMLAERESYVQELQRGKLSFDTTLKNKRDELQKKKSPIDQARENIAGSENKADAYLTKFLKEAQARGLNTKDDHEGMMEYIQIEMRKKDSEPHTRYGFEDQRDWSLERKALQDRYDYHVQKRSEAYVQKLKEENAKKSKIVNPRERRLAEEEALKNKRMDEMTPEEKANSDLADSVKRRDAENAMRYKFENDQADKNRKEASEIVYASNLRIAYGDGDAGYPPENMRQYYGLVAPLERYLPNIYAGNNVASRAELESVMKIIQEKLLDKSISSDDKIRLESDLENVRDVRYQLVKDSKEWLETHKQEAPQNKASGGLVYRAGGGSIFKAKGTDTVPAMLTPGEFVMQKSAVDKHGIGMMKHLNAGGNASYFQVGGGVGNKQGVEFGGVNLTAIFEKVEKMFAQLEDSMSNFNGSLTTGTRNIEPFFDEFGRLNFGSESLSIVKPDGNGQEGCCKGNYDSLSTVLENLNTRFLDTLGMVMGEGFGFASGGPVYRAAGGSIFQPRGTDTVPAMLTPGEFVIRKSAVDSIGVENLQAINNGELSKKSTTGRFGGGIPTRPMPKAVAKDKTSEGFALSRPGGSRFTNDSGNLLGMTGGAWDSTFNQANPFNPFNTYGGLPVGTVLPSVIQYGAGYQSPMDLFDQSFGAQARFIQQSAYSANSAAYQRMYDTFNRNSAGARQARLRGDVAGGGWNKPKRFASGGFVSYLAKGGKSNQFNPFNPYNTYGGLPVGTVLPSAIQYDANYQSPMQLFDQSFGAQARYIQGSAAAANDAAYQRMYGTFNRNSAAARRARMNGDVAGGGWNKPRRRRFSTGGAVYLAKGGRLAGGIPSILKSAVDETQTSSFGPNMSTIKSESTPYDFGMGIGPMGGVGGLSLNDSYLDKNSPFSPSNWMNQFNPYNTYGGLPVGTVLPSVIQYAGDYQSPMQLFDQSFGAQARYIQQSAYAANSAAYGRMWDTFNRNSAGARQARMNGDVAGGGWNKPKRFATGGLVSYLAKGGKPISGSYGVGGIDAVNSMIPTKPEARTDLLKGMDWNSLFNPFNTYGGLPVGTVLPSVIQYAGNYQSPMQLFDQSFGAQARYIQQSAYSANSAAYGRMYDTFNRNSAAARQARLNGNVAGGGWNKPKRFASGGPVSYFARGGSTDTIPAMLTPGEFVMNTDAVDKYGMAFMDHLNKGGSVRGYATGGAVGPVYRASGGVAPPSTGGRTAIDLNVDIGAISNTISSSIQRAFSSVGSIINLDSLNSLAATFSNLVQTLNGVAASVSNMNMTHQVNIDGMVNIGGLNTRYIAEAIKTEVGNMIVQTVKDILNRPTNTAITDTQVI